MGDQLPMVAKDGVAVVKGRIRPALASAVRLIVCEGYTIRDAAKAVGYAHGSLKKALGRAHVRAFRTDVKRAWMTSETERAWLGVASLARGAASEDVRLKAQRTILEAAGELNKGDDDARQTRQLINLTRIETHYHGSEPPNERLPGVIEAPEFIDVTPEPLDE